MRLVLVYLLLFVPLSGLYSQGPVGSIRGIITDRLTSEPVSGASVVLPEANPVNGTLTDSTGSFIFRNVKPGRYSLKITHIGYQDQILYDLMVISGKEMIIETALSTKTNVLGEVKIKGNSNVDPAEILNPGSRIISVEETMRYAATFNDPVRVAASFPQVRMINDQANHVVIRGNSPGGLLWRIEGADVVNPNHLTNAGTFSDKPSITGGGVAIISSQLLSESVFLSGAFPAEYGNVLSGIFDYRLRKGNNSEYEFTGQAGFLGTEFAVEGPFSSRYKGSFLINYRYSTIGLFELAGIPIGDEKINFQDLALNINLPSDKAGTFSLFAIGGKSITIFRAERDSSKWKYEQDRTDYDFYSDMGVAGFTHRIQAGYNSSINTSFAASYLKSGRYEDYINSDLTSSFSGSDRLDAGKISFSTFYTGNFGSSSIKAGVVINRDYNLFVIRPGGTDLPVQNSSAYFLIQPYIQWQINIGNSLLLNPGLHIQYSGFNREISTEPRLSLRWNPGSGTSLSASYGLHSRMQHPSIYFNKNPGNILLGLTKAHHFVAGYSKSLNADLVFRSELYFEYLFNIPVSIDSLNSFSAINLSETMIISDRLINNGTGKNYGIDVSLERNMINGFYYLLAGSLYDSKYKGSDGITRDTRFNGKYQVKVTTGKEFSYSRKKGMNMIGINVTSALAGGLRYTPIDLSLSASAGNTVFEDEKAFSEKFKDYFRMDIRLIWRKNKPGRTETFALDIQNATNRRNVAWIYYDEIQKSIVSKEQLGLIPFFSYRIEF